MPPADRPLAVRNSPGTTLVAWRPAFPDNGAVNLLALRERTREQHEATEALLSLTDPELDRARYGEQLQRFSRVVLGWEAWAAAHAPASLRGLVEERRRSPLLLQDLRFFCLEPEDARSSSMARLNVLLDGLAPDSAEYAAVFLGAMYVMEGSTLGGQYIARYVEEHLQLQPGEGDAYFRGYGERTGSMWNAFRDVLNALPDEQTDLVVRTARVMFACVRDLLAPARAQNPAQLDGGERTSAFAGAAR